jgi:tRNA 2-thiouridine synthesizing protein E
MEDIEMHTAQIQARHSDGYSSSLFDEDGFLVEESLWSKELAPALAAEEGVGELTEAHWRVIDHIREKYFRLGSPPSLRRVCRETSLSRAQIHNLFGGCLAIWRIAGLPNPGEEAKSYLV